MSRPSTQEKPPHSRADAGGAAALALLDAAIAAWLWFAFRRFTEPVGGFWTGLVAAAAVLPLLTGYLGLDPSAGHGRLSTAARALSAGAAGAALWAILSRFGWVGLTLAQSAWLGFAAAGLAWAARALLAGTRSAGPGMGSELARWGVLGVSATLMPLCFYSRLSLGSGDAHWYGIMLADFITQLRSGVFPIWVGQSVYAFNGAVSPLRFAPGFQVLGGLLDLLTGQSLEPLALRNLELALCALMGAYSCYACLRPIVGNGRWIACLLSVLWILGPGVVAPLMSGDQYMTFTAVPFVPLVLHGCWRVWHLDDRWGRFWIATGLAATWLCHPPVGMWMTLVAAGLYTLALLSRRRWAWEFESVGFMAAAFLVLGSWPFVSVIGLENQYKVVSSAGYAVEMIHRYFPANFLPINLRSEGLTTYQIGYALLAVLLLSLALLGRSRSRAAWAFALAALVVPLFALPVPWINQALWMHAPQTFVTINNVWPMQRLFLVWSAVTVFTAAIVLGTERVRSLRALRVSAFGLLAAGVVWSALEASKLEHGLAASSNAGITRLHENLNNLQLSRYAYSSFESTPGYFSHAYMDPWLENRLLDLKTQEPFLNNADAAAPRTDPTAGSPGAPVLVASGMLTASSVDRGNYYRLTPTLHLDPHQTYALRLEFADPSVHGTLQLIGGGLFREYNLPDSGAGVANDGPPRAFGSGATSSHVVPISFDGDTPLSPEAFFIADRYTAEHYPLASYRLYRYDRARLPVSVSSWIPYRAHVESPRPAFVETPRMWLRGWRAQVNGQPVTPERSLQNLLMVPVNAGPSDVTLEYHPPLSLLGASWALGLGWVGLAAAGAFQLVQWSGRERLPTAALHRLYALPRDLVWPRGSGRSALGRRIASLAVLCAAAAALVLVRRGTRPEAPPPGSGPLLLRFMRPTEQHPYSTPLLATGHPGAGVVVFLQNVDHGRVRLGADVWGQAFYSAPVEMPYHRVQTLVVSDSALYPLDDPQVRALSPSELAPLRSVFAVELNGRTLIREKAFAYESDPSDILIGRTRFGSLTADRFNGELLGAERLPIPRSLVLPWGRQARMTLRFPGDRLGATEPLLTLSSGPQSLQCSVTYLGEDRLLITRSLPAGGERRAEVRYDPSVEHAIDFGPGEEPGRPETLDIAVYFDGAHVMGPGLPPPGLPPVLHSGVGEAAGSDVRFTGPSMRLESVAFALPPAAPGTEGAEHLVVRLPSQKSGRREPLLTTGRAGAGDLVYVIYDDDHHVRLGIDHWGVGAAVSPPIAVDYAIPHEFWITSAALYPGAADPAFWKGLNPAEALRARSGITVWMDGRTVLAYGKPAYGCPPSEVVVGHNPIGGSTCDPDFSGSVAYAERMGRLLQPDSAP